jgi:signal transduction histidine kinase
MPTEHLDDAAQQQTKLLATLEQLLAIQATSVKPALDAASTLIAAAIGADKVDAFLYEPATHSLVAVGTSLTPMGQQQIALGLDHLAIANGGRSVEVYQTGQPYHNGHVDRDLGELRGVREGLGIRSQLSVPLTVDGVRRGVVQADSARPEAFSDTDVAFLGAVSHWVGLILQRAELVERRTQEAREEARRLVADELVTVLAHDLRNLLNPLLGRAGLLRSRAEHEGRARDQRDATLLLDSVRRLNRLINDLLDVGRLEQGLFRLSRQPLNLATLVAECAATLQTASFRVNVEVPQEVVVNVDADRLRQALENLLVNAQRHAPDSPVALLVDTEQRLDGEVAVVSVQDQGPGIAPELLERLTERFVRGRQSEGLGLGLYLAREIAATHGGTLEVSSTVGRTLPSASCFLCSLIDATRTEARRRAPDLAQGVRAHNRSLTPYLYCM